MPQAHRPRLTHLSRSTPLRYTPTRQATRSATSQPGASVGNNATLTPVTLVVYRDLRIGLAVTMAMFAAAIIIEVAGKHCVQGALSEYFYTPAHSIFIATLIGFGTLFFIYRGSSDS